MQCPRCAYQNRDGRTTCSLCHTPLQGALQHYTSSPPAPIRPESSPRSRDDGFATHAERSDSNAPAFVETHSGTRPNATKQRSFEVLSPIIQEEEDRTLPRPKAPPESLEPSLADSQERTIARVRSSSPNHQGTTEMTMNPTYNHTTHPETPAQFDAQATLPGELGHHPSHQAPERIGLHIESEDDHKTIPDQKVPRASHDAPPVSFLSEPKVQSSPPSQEALPTLHEAKPSPKVLPSTPPQHTTHRSRPAKDNPPLPKPRLQPNFYFAPTAQLPPLWRRFVAGVIDLAIVGFVAGLIALLFGPSSKQAFPYELHGLDFLATVLQRYTPLLIFFLQVAAVLYLLYTTVAHTLLQYTVGKKILSLRVVDRSGTPLTWVGSIARSVGFLLFFFVALIGISWIFIDNEYRGLHDRIAGSLVIHTT